jgi:hypothetical protein
VEVIEMIEELLVVEGTRREAEAEAPGEPVAAGRAVTMALRALEAGASVPEAIAVGGRYARNWSAHLEHAGPHGARVPAGQAA